jgi:hypothetical protein
LIQNNKTLNQKSNLPRLKNFTFECFKRSYSMNIPFVLKFNKVLNSGFLMKQKRITQISISEKSDTHIKNKEKKIEISIYALIIIVTVALMLIFFNIILRV